MIYNKNKTILSTANSIKAIIQEENKNKNNIYSIDYCKDVNYNSFH